jgi:hypothetical protein
MTSASPIRKPPKRRAYLVSVAQKHEPVRIYAALACSVEEALEAVSLNLSSEARLEIIGGLSRDLVKRLHLTPGETLQV